MQIARVALLFLAACVSASASAQEAAAARQECSDGRSHVEMRACLQAKAQTSAGELRKAEDEMRRSLMAWREEPIHVKRSLSEFEASLKQFSRYRQQHCELVASLAAGGNGQGDLRLSCIYELNAKRMAQLQQVRNLVQ